MRRVLSTVLAVALLLGLGALAVLALPNGNTSLAGAPAVSAAAPEFEPDAPDAFPQRLNMIALPLDARASFAKDGVPYPFTAKGLANYIGPAVIKVEQWITQTQTYQTSVPPYSLNNFGLRTGGVYMVTLNSSDPTLSTFSIVGNVPPASQSTPKGAPGRVEYKLAGAVSCKLNHITIPLDRSDILNAKLLAQAVGNVVKVEMWDAVNQVYKTSVNPFSLNNFATPIGYPFAICVTAAGNDQVWP